MKVCFIEKATAMLERDFLTECKHRHQEGRPRLHNRVHSKNLDTTPIFCKARPVPYAQKEAVEKELDRLEKAKVISKIERSEWAAPILTVPKAGKTLDSLAMR